MQPSRGAAICYSFAPAGTIWRRHTPSWLVTTRNAGSSSSSSAAQRNPVCTHTFALPPPRADLTALTWTRIPGSYQLSLSQQARSAALGAPQLR